ncbi:hypothetical protein C0J52_26986 [Blattella germanica]|nr:hypothetical protein C0J52_26986 [Blattella germanica]
MTDEASLSCPLCKSSLNSSDSLLLLCHRCLSWFHSTCLGLRDEEVENRATSNSSWSCPHCVSLEDPNDSISTCLDLVSCPVCIDKSFKEIGQRISRVSQNPKSTAFLIQRISITLQRGNMASILGTLPRGMELEEIFHL